METCTLLTGSLAKKAHGINLEHRIPRQNEAKAQIEETPLIPEVTREQVEALSRNHGFIMDFTEKDRDLLADLYISLNNIAEQIVQSLDFSPWLNEEDGQQSFLKSENIGEDTEAALSAMVGRVKSQADKEKQVQFTHAGRDYILTAPKISHAFELSQKSGNTEKSAVEYFELEEAGNYNEAIQFSFANLTTGQVQLKDISYINYNGLDDYRPNTMKAYFMYQGTKADEPVSDLRTRAVLCYKRAAG